MLMTTMMVGRGGNDGNRQADFLVESMRRSSPTVHECFLGVLLDENKKHSVRLYDESGEFFSANSQALPSMSTALATYVQIARSAT